MWQLQIQDPSGETRKFPLDQSLGSSFTVGSGGEIPFRDPTCSGARLELWPSSGSDLRSSPYWFRVSGREARLSDLRIREGHFPAGALLQCGETRLSVEPLRARPELPGWPAGVRRWLTQSESGRKILRTAKKAASTPLSVYLAGETGTGKEVMAQLLHSWSERASGPFVPLHCGALPLALAESELFGHVKGAFTGAHQHRVGALLQAHNGTLFLDEVGDLPLDIQVKLLRFLENGEIRAVGADHTSHADVRLICATHHPLRELVQKGKFRRDLYYRIASVTLELPALRDRLDDVELLASKFASELNRTLSDRALMRLKAHAWPGNVRELRHAIERASGLAGPFSPILTEEAFDFLLLPEHVEDRPELSLGSAVLSLEEMERIVVLKALRISGGNRTEAARILGIARSTLFVKLTRLGIQGPKKAA